MHVHLREVLINCMCVTCTCRYGLEDTPQGTYTGMFFEGRKHGYGVEERGGFCYRGYWNHGVRHGWGDWVVRAVEYHDKKSLLGKHRVSEIKVPLASINAYFAFVSRSCIFSVQVSTFCVPI
jgi:hypothetical protein